MNITEILVFWTAGRDAIPGVCAACPEVDAADCSYAAGRPHEAVVIAVVRDGVRALQIRDVLKARGMDAVLVEKVAPLRALQTLFARKTPRRASASVSGNSAFVASSPATAAASAPASSRFQRMHGSSPDERARVDERLRRLRAIRVAVVALGSMAIVFFVGLSVLLVVTRGESVDDRGTAHLRGDEVSPSLPAEHPPQATDPPTGNEPTRAEGERHEHVRREAEPSGEPGTWSLADSPLSFLIPSPASGAGLAGALAVLVIFPWLSRTRNPWLRRIAGWVVPTVGCGVAFALLVMIVAMLDASRASSSTETAHAGMGLPTQPASGSPGAIDAIAPPGGEGTSARGASDSLGEAVEAAPDFTRISAASFVARIRGASVTAAGSMGGADPRHAPVPRDVARSAGGPCADVPSNSASSLLCHLRAASHPSNPEAIDDQPEPVVGANDDGASERLAAAEPHAALPSDARPAPSATDAASAERGTPEPPTADRSRADSGDPDRSEAVVAAPGSSDAGTSDALPIDTTRTDALPIDTARTDAEPDIAASGPPPRSSLRPDRGGSQPADTPPTNATALAPALPNGSSPWRHPGWHFAGMFLFAATTIGAGRRLATRMEYRADNAVLPSSFPATASSDSSDSDASEEPT